MLSLIGYFPAYIITHRYVARMILLLHESSRAWRISVNGEKIRANPGLAAQY
jgi:hypothetical protein